MGSFETQNSFKNQLRSHPGKREMHECWHEKSLGTSGCQRWFLTSRLQRLLISHLEHGKGSRNTANENQHIAEQVTNDPAAMHNDNPPVCQIGCLKLWELR